MGTLITVSKEIFYGNGKILTTERTLGLNGIIYRFEKIKALWGEYKEIER